jgi:DNA-binding CsgD family transcriptional regulator
MNRLAAELDDLGGADITGALEDLPVRSFVIDADGVVRWQNAASRTAIGDWGGRKWVELVSEKQTEELEGVVRRMFCSGDPAEVTFDVREADGKMARREVSAAPLREGGAVVGLFGVSVPVGTQGTQAVASGSSPLTERQLEVLQLLAEGKSTSQIADELVLSATTVRNHIAHVLANLGVHTRVQAVIAGARAGLIRLPTADEPADPG